MRHREREIEREREAETQAEEKQAPCREPDVGPVSYTHLRAHET